MTAAVRGDLDQFWTALLFQLRSYVRTWRFLGLLLFVAGISAAVLGVRFFQGVDAVRTESPTAASFLGGFLGSVGTVVIISAGFLGGDALAVDLSGGPGYLMLTLPVRRRTLFAGRYAAAALSVGTVAGVYYAFALGGSLGLYGTVPWAIAVSLGSALLFGLAALAVAFFFSSFFRNPSVAIIASLLILFLGFPMVTGVAEVLGGEPWYSLDYGSGIIANVFANPFQHETVLSVGGGAGGSSVAIHLWSPYLAEGMGILLAYLAVFLVATWIVYRTKEVKG